MILNKLACVPHWAAAAAAAAAAWRRRQQQQQRRFPQSARPFSPPRSPQDHRLVADLGLPDARAIGGIVVVTGGHMAPVMPILGDWATQRTSSSNPPGGGLLASAPGSTVNSH